MSQGAPHEVGSTANSYVILAKLATGGMAELFLARNASGAGIERHVVLKRVLSHRMHDRALVAMFQDEARLAAQLQHPNIAQVYDTGVLGDSYFFTMEYVHGETVREILNACASRGEPVPIGCALAIAAGTAAGLHHAHERIGMDGRPLGIVHRDVSPSNLMVSYEGHVKVVDFGIAKASVRTTETSSGTVKGKISYLSPEQCRGRALDRRSDLFALGIVMWEMLAGARLFHRETDYESMEAIVHEPARSLRAVRPEIPASVDAIVQRMLAKEPDGRFQTAGALIEAIEQAAIAASIPLSSASVARFMRELFGTRPEPWIEMLARDTRAEAVTVTASAVFAEVNHVTSAQLAAIPALARPVTASHEAVRVPPSGASTVPVARVEPTGGDEPTTMTASRGAGAPRTRRRLAIGLAIGACAAAAAVGIGATHITLASHPARDAASIPSAPVFVEAAPVFVEAAPHAVAAPSAVTIKPADATRTEARSGDKRPATLAAHPPPREPVLSPADRLARAIRGEHNAETVALCAGNRKLASDNIVSCMLAACRVHETARAKHWLEQAGAQRHDELVRACRATGTDVEPQPVKKPPEPDCDADPMACRH